MTQHCRGASALALLTAGAAVLSIAPVSHAAAQEQAPDMRACAAEKDDAERLRCYDRALARHEDGQSEDRDDERFQDRSREDRPSDAPQDRKAAAPAAAQAASEAQFGYRGDLAREEREAAKREQIERMDATVAKVASQPRGELILTLDNGQVWQQKSTDRRIRLKAGDKIVIKSGALGSFMLVTAEGRSTRVSRVR